MKFLAQLWVALAVVAATKSSSVPANEKNFELLILHNNDMHARFEQTSQLSGACTTADREAGKCYGGFPRVAHVVKEAREAAATGNGPPVLYLNAGDTYTGTAWFTIYKWKIAAEFVNALQPDAISLGNHEFDNGVSGLTPFIENLTCPVLAANLVLTKVPELAMEANLKKTVVVDVAGKKIGVIGYLTPETKFKAIPNDVEYIDEVVALREEVKNLQSIGINIIIALGHSGFLRDLEIAKQVDGLDLVIGGHSNTFLWNGTSPDTELVQGYYPTYVTQASGKRVPVVQAYAYTKYLGKLLLVFDASGELKSTFGNPILLDKSVSQDLETLNIVNRYSNMVRNFTETVVGNTSVVLDGLGCQLHECNLGNLITDAVIYFYAKHYVGEHWTDAAIAIIQGGAIRSSIAHAVMPYNLTKGDLLSIMPFDGYLLTVTMNGSVLLQALEHAVAKYDLLDDPGEFLQFSGLKVVYDLTRPSGSRVITAEARCWACNIPEYSFVKEKEVYKLLMSNFLYGGGDGYWMFKGLPSQVLEYSELTCTEYYIEKRSPIYPQVEGRTILLSPKVNTGSATVTSVSYAVALMSIIHAILA